MHEISSQTFFKDWRSKKWLIMKAIDWDDLDELENRVNKLVVKNSFQI